MNVAKDAKRDTNDSYLERRARASLELIRKKSEARRRIEDEKRRQSS